MFQKNSDQVISGKKIASLIKTQVKEDIDRLRVKIHRKPRVVSLISGDNAEARLYLKLRNKACNQVGIEPMQHEFSSQISKQDLIKEIHQLNTDENVDGILVQLPLPDHINQQHVLSEINPSKDVEGFTSVNMGRLVNNNPFLVPCTPLAVMKILAHHQVQIKGAHVVIVNHSTVVGKPLALLCLQKNATVSVAHVFTEDLKAITRQADVLITAAGVPGLITEDHVKQDAVVIDVAIVSTNDGITGDVDFEKVKNKASLITPVPGGVGPVTIASALENMVKATKASFKGENTE
ncbi:MAG: bifunctional 5,10-methylenetetrahydrofolate dehydrogenase/5,10-methenyltetrahydrofolate cyclohydrolase [Candidatus Thermoplasmatota archaeon]|nr:bifunctional 5,10-methylenetetrahydrofolate dehydrogenase/5,10-methenyltetrahydrofolate cyclohydrolase [Candidatus Thermoplasmatota archaeon]